MNGHTAVIRYWPGHGCYSCDNARCRIIAKNSVCGFTVFPSSTKDIDFSITHRHATILLFQNTQRNIWLFEKEKFQFTHVHPSERTALWLLFVNRLICTIPFSKGQCRKHRACRKQWTLLLRGLFQVQAFTLHSLHKGYSGVQLNIVLRDDHLHIRGKERQEEAEDFRRTAAGRKKKGTSRSTLEE